MSSILMEVTLLLKCVFSGLNCYNNETVILVICYVAYTLACSVSTYLMYIQQYIATVLNNHASIQSTGQLAIVFSVEVFVKKSGVTPFVKLGAPSLGVIDFSRDVTAKNTNQGN